ncbi:MAG: hypothetical protein H7A51_13280 [Akkermansiaceae bacterium]|nr:hypothetical protein [Akkermansiaceae bacterium]
MKGLIEANLHYLQQAAALVDALEDGSYVRAEPMFYNSTVGGHLRHCLDHYESFARGVSEGKIDYDCRCRDQQVENKTHVARSRINTIIGLLERLADQTPNKSVLIKMDCGGASQRGQDNANNCAGGAGELWQSSTLGRELQFLVSHTVHHFAMIRGICQRAGESLDADFGMAPSTLRYREQLGNNKPTAD